MLGFNKYVIPFQRESQTLPFNVAGLDTIKYNARNFEEKAIRAIDEAIKATIQTEVPQGSNDQSLNLFLLQRGVLMATLEDEGERSLFRLGEPLGFNLLTNFGGNDVIFLGRFTMLRAESIIWRIRKLAEVLNGRIDSIPFRVQAGLVTEAQVQVIRQIFSTLKFWVLVSSDLEKVQIQRNLSNQPINYVLEVITLKEAMTEIELIPGFGV